MIWTAVKLNLAFSHDEVIPFLFKLDHQYDVYAAKLVGSTQKKLPINQ